MSILVTTTRSRLEVEELMRRVLESSDLLGFTVESVRGEHSLSMSLSGRPVVPMPSLPGD